MIHVKLRDAARGFTPLYWTSWCVCITSEPCEDLCDSDCECDDRERQHHVHEHQRAVPPCLKYRA
eukprot:41857-Eustigmatos_ZCMA.PRE.1